MVNSIGTLLSRISGIVRLTVISYLFGAKADPFTAAFKTVNNLRKIIGEGAMNNAFVPVYKSMMLENEEQAQKFASNVINIFLFFTAIFTVIAALAAPFYSPLLVPGYQGERMTQFVILTIIMMPFVILICLFAMAMAILNSHQRFFSPSFAPFMMNVVSVLVPIFMYKDLGVFSLGVGVLAGTLTMFLMEVIELVVIRFRYSFYLNFKDPALKPFLKLFIPSAANMSVLMLVPIVNNLFISLLPEGSQIVFFNAFTTIEAPLEWSESPSQRCFCRCFPNSMPAANRKSSSARRKKASPF